MPLRSVFSNVTMLALVSTAGAEQLAGPVIDPAGSAGAQLGAAVAIDAGTAAIGAPYQLVHDELLKTEERTGIVHLYDLPSRSLQLAIDVQSLGDGAAFGYDVAIAGGRVLAGAPGDDSPAPFAGSAYLFDSSTGELLHAIALPTASSHDLFGYSLALDGTTAVIGAPGDDDNIYEDPTGAVYVYDAISGALLLPRVVPDNSSEDQLFGWSVDIDGDTILAGAPDEGGAGAAYLFAVSTGLQLHRLAPDDADPEHFAFGRDVALTGNLAIVGAPAADRSGPSSGLVYVFDVLTGSLLHTIEPDDAQPQHAFGFSVAAAGGQVLIGASGDVHAGDNTGSAYLFDAAGGALIERWTASDAAAHQRFGHAVALHEDIGLIGASLRSSVAVKTGGAYFFEHCPADVDDDGTIGVDDLVEVILQWDCQDQDLGCAADVDSDGDVDVDDLVTVITAWGPC